MRKTYTFHTDPGHGWLEVGMDELVFYGIVDDVSPYSYRKGATAYLEEDCDATLFIRAYKAHHGTEVKFVEKHKDNTPVRGYAPYTV